MSIGHPGSSEDLKQLLSFSVINIVSFIIIGMHILSDKRCEQL